MGNKIKYTVYLTPEESRELWCEFAQVLQSKTADSPKNFQQFIKSKLFSKGDKKNENNSNS